VVPTAGLTVPKAEDVLTDAPMEQPTPGEQPPITGTAPIDAGTPTAGEQPSITGDVDVPAEPAPKPAVPGEIEPKSPHTCPDGQHWDVNSNICMPDEDFAEMVRRIKAEAALVISEKGRKAFEQYYIDKLTPYRRQNDRLRKQWLQQKGAIETLTTQNNRFSRDLVEAQTERDSWKRRRDELAGDRDDLRRQLEKLGRSYEELYKTKEQWRKQATEKMNEANKLNLDYLKISQENEELQEALKRAKVMAKKTLKIRV